ncbi:flagellar basal body rod protein FlgB [Exilibacterium tricleocarpae]|uniref:Flagellar basal body rod protein FlgB n=1 Tax=Exilibacterium tricleocarpae TaxID=2591008 RepID=A0A545U3T4_9GAMM|nr:flagellar basal body rod protein FlgB [Exilibacterium tricleocarpae]TQV84130.1 flagellar basal body rod protein FlgB [Exilibacterium tricleocarpae]
MSINFEKALGIHGIALQLRSRRAAVLANNLANTDTPNFRARDIDFHSLVKARMQGHPTGLPVTTTHAGHQRSLLQAGDRELLYRTPQQPAVDGNTVEEQVEHAEFMKNALAYQASFRFLNGTFKGLKTAIRGQL